MDLILSYYLIIKSWKIADLLINRFKRQRITLRVIKLSKLMELKRFLWLLLKICKEKLIKLSKLSQDGSKEFLCWNFRLSYKLFYESNEYSLIYFCLIFHSTKLTHPFYVSIYLGVMYLKMYQILALLSDLMKKSIKDSMRWQLIDNRWANLVINQLKSILIKNYQKLKDFWVIVLELEINKVSRWLLLLLLKYLNKVRKRE